MYSSRQYMIPGHRMKKQEEMCKSLACFIRFTTYCKTNEGNSSAFPFEGAFVKGIDAVSWMANNSSKLSSGQGNGPHCWTFFSTAAFGERTKVPQENIPNATAEKVKIRMLEGVEIALGLSKGSLKRPLYSRLQLW
ncbi:hypothetical protein Ancab_000939 [Ancistrocladus abbreviatus]